MGIRDKPIAAGAPWQNGFAERLIGTLRRECVDHVIVQGEAHLRRMLIKFAHYYNNARIHRALAKAVSGEARAADLPRKAKAAIGLSIAVELVRRGLAVPT